MTRTPDDDNEWEPVDPDEIDPDEIDPDEIDSEDFPWGDIDDEEPEEYPDIEEMPEGFDIDEWIDYLGWEDDYFAELWDAYSEGDEGDFYEEA
jgi:hypothetical protein